MFECCSSTLACTDSAPTDIQLAAGKVQKTSPVAVRAGGSLRGAGIGKTVLQFRDVRHYPEDCTVENTGPVIAVRLQDGGVLKGQGIGKTTLQFPDARHSAMGSRMEYIKLPGTDLRVSRICLGTMQFSNSWEWPCDQATATAIVRAALASGINFFDTAQAYQVDGNRCSERMLGIALADIDRSEVVIASKFVRFHLW